YLRQRLRDYDYNQHMGGVYYLFLRGMRPATGPRYGVHHDLPPESLIDELDSRVLGYQSQNESSMTSRLPDRGEPA
ncbi:MAG: hypothetical protein WBJ75_02415, partial [Pseudohongiellaceae bacterium]